MTLSDIEEEKKLETMTSTSTLNQNATDLSLTISPISPITDSSFKYHIVVKIINLIQLQLNLKTKPADVVLDAIIREEDRILARKKCY